VISFQLFGSRDISTDLNLNHFSLVACDFAF